MTNCQLSEPQSVPLLSGTPTGLTGRFFPSLYFEENRILRKSVKNSNCYHLWSEIRHISSNMEQTKGASYAPGTPNRKKTSNGSTAPGTPGSGKKARAGIRDFEVGTRIEAKDFNGKWWQAKIAEVDWEEREVLIHFDKVPVRYDEWMPMDSSRMRPLKELPAEPKQAVVERRFKVGEQVMATWSNNCKYPATVLNTEPNDRYDVLFYDGFRKSVRGTKISKMKESDQVHAQQKMQQIQKQQLHIQQKKQLQMQQAQQSVQKPLQAPQPPQQRTYQQLPLQQPQQSSQLKKHLQNGSFHGSNSVPVQQSKPVQSTVHLEQRSLQPQSHQLTGVQYAPMLPSAPQTTPIVDGLLPVDENIGTKEQRRERKRKFNAKELFSSKRPRGSASEKHFSVKEKKVTNSIHGGRTILGSGSPSGGMSPMSPPMLNSSVASPGSGPLLGVDPMFPANPVKVEGGFLPSLPQEYEQLDVSNVEIKRKRKRIKKKKEVMYTALFTDVEGADTTESSSSLAKKAQPQQQLVDDVECSIQWHDGEPQGEAAYVIESAEGPRKSIIVDDRRLPEGWSKHAIRRQGGTSAGKWDVFLVSPRDGRKFRSRNELRSYHIERGLKFQVDRFDFSLGRKKMNRNKAAAAARAAASGDRSEGSTSGTPTSDASNDAQVPPRPSPVPSPAPPSHLMPNLHPPAPHSITPQVTPHGVQRVKTLLPRVRTPTAGSPNRRVMSPPPPHAIPPQPILPTPPPPPDFASKKSLSAGTDGYECPKDGCAKRFRRENLLQMHIKHYHPEYTAFMGSTPNVADLAYARTVGEPVAEMPSRNRGQSSSFMEKVEKIARMEANRKAASVGGEPGPPPSDCFGSSTDSASSLESRSPTLGLLLKKGPMRKDSVDGTTAAAQAAAAWMVETAGDTGISLLTDCARDHKSSLSSPVGASLDNIMENLSRPSSRAAGMPLETGSDQEVGSENVSVSPWKMGSSVTLPGADGMSVSSSSSPVPIHPPSFFYSKKKSISSQMDKLNVEPYKHVDDGKPISPPTTEHLRREELINCTCGFTEEDGLMMQCDLCLCWQHGLCNKIENVEDVPDKYVCQICLNPVRERRSRHYVHDQDWLKEGTLPTLSILKRDQEAQQKREDLLKRSHDLCALLLQMQKVIHTVRVKVHIVEQKDHPKLYLWANSWVKESAGCPTPPSSPVLGLDVKPKLEPMGVMVKGKSLLQEALLNGSPHQQQQLGILDRFSPISNNMQLVDAPRVPQPEAPIDPRECRLKLLDHIEHYQSVIDSRLNALEQQIAALEQEDPTLLDENSPPETVVRARVKKVSDSEETDAQHDDSTDFFPQTKETMQMLLRDLLIMRKISSL